MSLDEPDQSGQPGQETPDVAPGQADLAPLFGSPSIVSEVLSGKRHLALSHVQKLAAHFGVPADVFILS